jgi:hypothetical protein
VFDSHDAVRRRRVNELAVAQRDADVRRARTRRREEQEVAGSHVPHGDLNAADILFADRSRHVHLVSLEDVPHESAAIEPRRGLRASKAVGYAQLGLGAVEDLLRERRRGWRWRGGRRRPGKRMRRDGSLARRARARPSTSGGQVLRWRRLSA